MRPIQIIKKRREEPDPEVLQEILAIPLGEFVPAVREVIRSWQPERLKVRGAFSKEEALRRLGG